MKNKWIGKLGIILGLALNLLACQPAEQEEAAAEQTYGAAQVKVFKVRKQKISEKLLYTGVIGARKKIVINPDIGGKIASIHVEEGDRVRQGQVLAELDTRAIRLQLEQAEAQRAVAEASSQDARNNLERWERLRKENAVSEQQYEQVKLAHDAARSQLQQAAAAVNLAKYNLDVSIMEAPFDGIIAAKNAEVGDVVNPLMGGFGAASGVLTLMDFSTVKISVEVSHTDVVRIAKGQTAYLGVSVYPDKVFEGRVTVVNLAADPLSKKFGVVIQVSNPELLLKPNTFGDVTLEVSSQENALVIPQQAVLENRFVYVADNGKALKREISIGLQNTSFLEVIQGLQEGELVVVEGNYGLDEGAEIEVKEVLQ
ncbi:MAG: efflux RND transporter periplasmic adaptor subunit [Candidatus Aminicenantaceae bacterium]